MGACARVSRSHARVSTHHAATQLRLGLRLGLRVLGLHLKRHAAITVFKNNLKELQVVDQLEVEIVLHAENTTAE